MPTDTRCHALCFRGKYTKALFSATNMANNLFSSAPASPTSPGSPILFGNNDGGNDDNDGDIFEREFPVLGGGDGGCSSSTAADDQGCRKFSSYAAAASSLLFPVGGDGGGVGGDDDAETFCDERGGGQTSNNEKVLDKVYRSISMVSMRYDGGDNHGDCCGDESMLSEKGYAYFAWHPTMSVAMDDVGQGANVTQFDTGVLANISKMDEIPAGAVVSGPLPYNGIGESWKTALGQPRDDCCEDLKGISKCSICLSMVHNPCKASERCSMHFFCRSCLFKQWSASRTSEDGQFRCPMCREKCSDIGTFEDTSASSLTNSRKIGEIKLFRLLLTNFAFFNCVTCNKTNMSYQQNLEHVLLECTRTPVYCPNSTKTRGTSSYSPSSSSSSSSTCNAVVTRGELDAHLRKCPARRTVECGLCNNMVNTERLYEHVTKQCNKGDGRVLFMCNQGGECRCSDDSVPTQVKQSDIYFGFIFPQLYDKNVLPRPLVVNGSSQCRPACAYRNIECVIPNCPHDNIRFHEMQSHMDKCKAEHRELLQVEIATQKEAMGGVETEIEASRKEERNALEILERQTAERIEGLKRKFKEEIAREKRECEDACGHVKGDFERDVDTKRRRIDALSALVERYEDYIQHL